MMQGFPFINIQGRNVIDKRAAAIEAEDLDFLHLRYLEVKEDFHVGYAYLDMDEEISGDRLDIDSLTWETAFTD